MKRPSRFRLRLNGWLMGWAYIADGLAVIFSLGYWWPSFSFNLTVHQQVQMLDMVKEGAKPK